jgi:hypothetical protein
VLVTRPILRDNAAVEPGLLSARRIILIAGTLLAIGGASAPTAAAQVAPAPVAGARLQGDFVLNGQVTVAVRIRGERTGEKITRNWTFTPLCPAGQCRTVTLLRRRHAGVDRVTLLRRSPGHYSGRGSFAAPLQCDGATYPTGARVPFMITVRIDSAVVSNGTVIASRVSATYTNAVRINLTPCVAVLGHDAAAYHGHVVLPPGS